VVHFFKSFFTPIQLSILISCVTLLSAEANSNITKKFELIDLEEMEILDLLQQEKNKIQKAKEKEILRVEAEQNRIVAEQKRIAYEKHQAEILEAKAKLKKLEEEQQRLANLQEAIKKEEELKQEAEKRDNRITVCIDISQQHMKVFKGDNLINKWRVSTARKGYDTPVGSYQPQLIQKMHYSKLYHNSPMPYSIFYHGNYAIHGTRAVNKLGKKASHGCVRLHTKNAKKLYSLVRKYGKNNTFINIVY